MEMKIDKLIYRYVMQNLYNPNIIPTIQFKKKQVQKSVFGNYKNSKKNKTRRKKLIDVRPAHTYTYYTLGSGVQLIFII